MNINKKMAAFALPLIAVSSMLSAASYSKQNCEPSPPAACNPDDCCRTYCLGPENYGVNAAVRPRTCNGDWVIGVAGLYWNAHQDGMEYAVDSKVQSSTPEDRVRIIDAEYLNPSFDWNWGFKAGLGYNSTCDGWDFGIVWTRYNGSASSHNEAENDDNHTLLPLWTNFSTNPNDNNVVIPIFATDIQTQWNLNLDLVDLELGREFWNSKRLALRPHIGLRIARVKQSFEIEHKGGSWSETGMTGDVAQSNKVDLDNDFKGIGIRGGLNSVWNLGCGWALYGDTALSIIYGRFHVDHDEMNRDTAAPFSKSKFFESKDTFRASRLVADLGLGIQWSSLFCDCQYGLTVKLGWENHLFLDQNQMWRVTKVGYLDDPSADYSNSFSQRRGDLDTQGWTLAVIFDF